MLVIAVITVWSTNTPQPDWNKAACKQRLSEEAWSYYVTDFSPSTQTQIRDNPGDKAREYNHFLLKQCVGILRDAGFCEARFTSMPPELRDAVRNLVTGGFDQSIKWPASEDKITVQLERNHQGNLRIIVSDNRSPLATMDSFEM